MWQQYCTTSICRNPALSLLLLILFLFCYYYLENFCIHKHAFKRIVATEKANIAMWNTKIWDNLGFAVPFSFTACDAEGDALHGFSSGHHDQWTVTSVVAELGVGANFERCVFKWKGASAIQQAR